MHCKFRPLLSKVIGPASDFCWTSSMQVLFKLIALFRCFYIRSSSFYSVFLVATRYLVVSGQIFDGVDSSSKTKQFYEGSILFLIIQRCSRMWSIAERSCLRFIVTSGTAARHSSITRVRMHSSSTANIVDDKKVLRKQVVAELKKLTAAQMHSESESFVT